MKKAILTAFLLILSSAFAQMQGSVLVLEGNKAFIDMGSLMGLSNNIKSGTLYRGDQQVAKLKVLQVGYDITLARVRPLAGQTVQVGDIAIFGSSSSSEISSSSNAVNVGGVESYNPSSPQIPNYAPSQTPSYTPQASNFSQIIAQYDHNRPNIGQGPTNHEISLGRPLGGYATQYTGTVEPSRTYNFDLLIVEGTPLANLLQLAWDMRVYGFPQEALQAYQIILERYPQSYEVHSALASYYRELGDWQNARLAYNNALRYASGEQVSAANYFLNRIDRDARWGIAAVDNFEMGYASFEKGDYNNARAFFSQATYLAPDWVEGIYWLARSQLQLGNIEEARTGLNIVLEVESDTSSDIYKGAEYLLTTL